MKDSVSFFFLSNCSFVVLKKIGTGHNIWYTGYRMEVRMEQQYEQQYNYWIMRFMESWKNLDWKETLNLLAPDVQYYQNPIDDPCRSFDEVADLWKEIEMTQKDIFYQYQILCSNNELCMVHYQMERYYLPTKEKQKIDGIMQVSLDEKGLCNCLKQWQFMKSEPIKK